jgi:hypothetical protein
MTVEALADLHDLHTLIAKTTFRNRVTKKHYVRLYSQIDKMYVVLYILVSKQIKSHLNGR